MATLPSSPTRELLEAPAVAEEVWEVGVLGERERINKTLGYGSEI